MFQPSTSQTSTDSDSVKNPLLHGSHGEERDGTWWEKLLDVNEAKEQILFSMPMILTNLSYFSITMISVMFAGHLGDVELAGATLANSWANVTGFAFMVILTSDCDSLVVMN